MTDGETIGTTKRALGTLPGEKNVHTYTGMLAHGESIHTYMSGFDAYFTNLNQAVGGGSNNRYLVNVYQTNASNYGQVYFSVYSLGDSAGAGSGQVAAANAVKVNSLIIGDG